MYHLRCNLSGLLKRHTYGKVSLDVDTTGNACTTLNEVRYDRMITTYIMNDGSYLCYYGWFENVEDGLLLQMDIQCL